MRVFGTVGAAVWMLATGAAWASGDEHAAEKSGVHAMTTQATHHSWSVFPGVYRSYDGLTTGGEISVLHRNKGLDVGVEKGKIRYTEVEVAYWVIALGAGVRFPEDRSAAAFQITWAFPLLPLFPYGRWTSDPKKPTEYGLMFKVPLLDVDEWFD